jgi:hypothetical protein
MSSNARKRKKEGTDDQRRERHIQLELKRAKDELESVKKLREVDEAKINMLTQRNEALQQESSDYRELSSQRNKDLAEARQQLANYPPQNLDDKIHELATSIVLELKRDSKRILKNKENPFERIARSEYTHQKFIDTCECPLFKDLLRTLFSEMQCVSLDSRQSSTTCDVERHIATILAAVYTFVNGTSFQWDFGWLLAFVMKCLTNSAGAVDFLGASFPGTPSNQHLMQKMKDILRGIDVGTYKIKDDKVM